jgi:hypothetical protein
MTSRVGRFVSRMYGGKKREAKGVPRLEVTRSDVGVGGSRGRSECEEAMATRPAGAKKRVSASASSGPARAMQRSGEPPGARMAGVAKTRPSAER